VQRVLREHLVNLPDEAPLTRLRRSPRLPSLPSRITRRWPAATDRLLTAGPPALAALPIDHAVPPAPWRGGTSTATRLLRTFVQSKLARYGEQRNHPDDDATSRMSPYLHFGHVSAHEIFSAVMTQERFTTRRLGLPRGGAREGWCPPPLVASIARRPATARSRRSARQRKRAVAEGVSASAEAFLDQLVVWRHVIGEHTPKAAHAPVSVQVHDASLGQCARQAAFSRGIRCALFLGLALTAECCSRGRCHGRCHGRNEEPLSVTR
jgi:deoxyribodipyrimidine photo-lyase